MLAICSTVITIYFSVFVTTPAAKEHHDQSDHT